MEPVLRVTDHQVTGSAILAASGRVTVSVSDSVFDPVLSFNMRIYRGVVSTEQHHLGKLISAVSVSVPVTALLVYLFQLVPVIFTYLRAVCPCDVTTFLDLTSFRLLTRSGRGRVTGSKAIGSARVPGQKS